MDLLSYGFFWKALLAGVAFGFSAAPIGLFLIVRRDSLLPHALTHIAFTGVALGLLLKGTPLLPALIITVLSAFVVLEIRERSGVYEDTAVGILASLGLALAIVLASRAENYDVRLLTYLFGNILVLNEKEALLSGAICLLVLGVLYKLGEALFFISFDEESARTSGLPVKGLKLLLSVVVAVLVVLGMKMVGLLLASALMVIPGASALELARSLRQSLLLSALFGGLSVAGGLVISVALNLPPSGAIVLFSGGLFFLSLGLRRLK